MARPKRIQLRRTKGWRMPVTAVKVDRSTKWGNPFVVGEDGTRAECVALFRQLLTEDKVPPAMPFAKRLRTQDARAYIRAHLDQLRGHDLACWCSLDQPCHADVLLDLANVPRGASNG